MNDHYKLGFRPDIEALRALAVGLVVLCHAKVAGFKGGFVGVDIFFVISGYLITGLLVKEIEETGRLNLLNFYFRRFKRLLPALLVVMLVSMAVAARLLSPLEQLPMAPSAQFVPFWLSNLFFAGAQLDYFGAEAGANIFLHTWSLGVEEQFYVVWPLAVLFMMGAFRWQGQSKPNRNRLLTGMLLVLFVGWAFSAFLSYTKPVWGYYLMPSRAWQFSAGAIALLLSVRWSHLSTNSARDAQVWRFPALSLAVPVGALCLIAGVAGVDEAVTYPGVWALLPTLGTALFLFGMKSIGNGALRQLLSLWPLQWLGRISYGFYLWHWPVLLIGGTLVEPESGWTFLLVGVALLLAALTYVIVENPIRFGGHFSLRPARGVVLSLVLMCAAAGVAATWERLAKGWVESPQQNSFVVARKDVSEIYGMGCDEWFYSARVVQCWFGPGNSQKVAVLLGDSVLAQWFPAIKEHLLNDGWRLLVLTKSACPMVDEPYFYPKIGRRFVECEVWRNTLLDYLAGLKPALVIMGSSRNYPFNEAQWINGSSRVLARIASSAERVVLVQSTWWAAFDGPVCLSREFWRTGSEGAGCVSPAVGVDSPVYAWLRSASAGLPNINVVDLSPLVCPGQVCAAKRDGVFVFRDFLHITSTFARSLTAEVAARITPPASTNPPPDNPSSAPQSK